MPQLDKVTFLSQFFWLCLFYLGFYYLVLKYFLPKISRILTLRKKKMNLSHYGSHSLQQENIQVRQNLDTILSRGFSLSTNVFKDFFSRTTNWLQQSLTSVNKTHYKTVNNSYIHSLGEASLSQNIVLYHASLDSPENLKANLLLDKIKKLRKTKVSLPKTKNKTKKIEIKQVEPVLVVNKEKTEKTEKKPKKNPKPKKNKK